MQLEWNNTNPEQRRALDTFYQSLQNFSAQPEASQRIVRQQHLEQLRDMSSEQRQQMFRRFVQQRENLGFR
jgi:flagellar hook-associated protein FlgK